MPLKCFARKSQNDLNSIRRLAQSSSATMTKGLKVDYVVAIQKDLEEELHQESMLDKLPTFARSRKKLANVLRSKCVLLSIVCLCAIDCSFVLGEVILDLYSIKGRMQAFELAQNKCLQDSFHSQVSRSTGFLEESRNYSKESIYHNYSVEQRNVTDPPIHHPVVHDVHAHTIEEQIGHHFHMGSVAILAVLFTETCLKIMCAGRSIIKYKIEIFDAVVVTISFMVDLAFVDGYTKYRISNFVLLLAFLLPWRVIRVVDSLVVGVISHEHLKLRLIYSEKKKIEKKAETTSEDIHRLTVQLEALKTLCLEEGIYDTKIANCLELASQKVSKGKGIHSLAKLLHSNSRINMKTQNSNKSNGVTDSMLSRIGE